MKSQISASFNHGDRDNIIKNVRATEGKEPRSLADLLEESLTIYSGLVCEKDVNFYLLWAT